MVSTGRSPIRGWVFRCSTISDPSRSLRPAAGDAQRDRSRGQSRPHRTGWYQLVGRRSEVGSFVVQPSQIRVDPYGRQQVMLNAIVAEVNRGRTEQDGINWSVADQRLGLSLFNNLGGGPATSVGASGVTSTGAPFVSPAGYLPYGGTLLPLTLSNNLTYGLAGSNGNYNANA